MTGGKVGAPTGSIACERIVIIIKADRLGNHRILYTGLSRWFFNWKSCFMVSEK